MDHDRLLRQHRRKLLVDPQSMATSLDVGTQGIQKIIPHRWPFLLIDRLTAIDLDRQAVVGLRRIDPGESVFEGHFPDYPVYPGTLQVEMIGQLGLCLHYFMNSRKVAIDLDARPVAARATRLIGAYFLEPVRPGDRLVVIAKKLEDDQLRASVIGQTVCDAKVCCVAVGEAILM